MDEELDQTADLSEHDLEFEVSDQEIDEIAQPVVAVDAKESVLTSDLLGNDIAPDLPPPGLVVPIPPDVPDALRHSLEAVQATPEDVSSWDQAEALAAQFERPDELALIYRTLLNDEQSTLDPSALRQLGERAVDFHDEWYADPQYSIALLRRLVRLTSGDQALFNRLTLLLTSTERWPDLLAEYEHALEQTQDVHKQISLLQEAARIARDFAGDAGRASDYLIAHVLLCPEDEHLAQGLERRLEQQERYSDLIKIWQVRLAVMDASVALQTKQRMGELQLHKLSRASEALVTARELLAAGGSELGYGLLEAIGRAPSAEETTRRDALSLLGSELERAGRGEDVIRVLGLRLGIAPDEAGQVALHQQMAESLAAAGRLPEAVEHWARVLKLVPRTLAAQTQLRRGCEEAGLHDRYVEALLDAMVGCDEAARRLDLLLEAAAISDRVLQDASRAIELYSQALEDQEAPPEQQLGAAQALTALLTAPEHRPQRLEVLELLAALAPPKQRPEILSEAAALADELGQVSRALGLWQRKHELDPRELQAIDAKIEILRREQRWAELIEELNIHCEISKEVAEKCSDLVHIASIFEDRLEQPKQAIETWQRVRQTAGNNAQATDALVRLYQSVGDDDSTIALLTEIQPHEADAQRQTAQLSTLGRIYQHRKAQHALAVEYFTQALAIDGQSPSARAGLRELLSHPSDGIRLAAAETLAQAFEDNEEWLEWLALVELRAASPSIQAKRRADMLKQAALVHEVEFHNPAEALQLLGQAFVLLAEPEFETELQRLGATTSDWHAVVAAYEQASAHCPPARRLELLWARAQILEEQLRDPAAALRVHQDLLALDPSQLNAALATVRLAHETTSWQDAARALVQLSAAVGQVSAPLRDSLEAAANQAEAWPEVAQHLEEQIGAVSLPAPVRHGLLEQLGIWYQQRARDDDAAERVLGQACAALPTASSLTRLAQLQRRHPGRALADTLLALSKTESHALDALEEAAHVALESSLDDAETILGKLLDLGAERLASEASAAQTTCWAIDRLVERALASGRARDALGLLERGADLALPDDNRIDLCFRAACVAAQQLDDTQRAIALAQRVHHDDDPQHAGAIALLAQLYVKTGQFDKLLDLHLAELDFAPQLERRLELRLSAANTLERLQRSAEEQVNVIEQNLAERPGHPPSVARLVQLLQALAAPERVYRLLSQQAEALEGIELPVDAAELWAQAGRCAEHDLNDPVRALGCYERAVALEPRVDVFGALAELHIAANAPKLAVPCLEHRLELIPQGPATDPERRASVVKLGQCLVLVGRSQDATQRLGAELARDPAADQIRQLLASLHRDAEQYSLLGPLLSEGVGFAPSVEAQVEYLREAAEVFRRHMNDAPAAIDFLREAVELTPDDKGLRVALADALGSEGLYDEALELLRQLLEEFGRRRTPERAKVHYQIAKIAQAQEDLDGALEQLEAASSILRSDPSILNLLGQVARRKGQLERAEKAYRTLLLILGRRSTEPTASVPPRVGSSTLLLELSEIASEMGQHERARDLLDSAIEAAAEAPEEAERLELVLSKSDNASLLLKVIDLRLRHTEAVSVRAAILQRKAEVLLRLERPLEALNARLDALLLTPEDLELRRATLEQGESLGEEARLADTLVSIASLDVTLPETACDLWLSLGNMALRQGNLDRAVDYLVRAQSTEERAVDCLDALERVLGSGGRNAELAQARRRFTENPASSTAPERLAQTLFALAHSMLCETREIDDGVMCLERALDLDPDLPRAVQLLVESMRQPHPVAAELLERVARRSDDEATILLALSHSAKLDSIDFERLQEATLLAARLQDSQTLEALLERTVQLGDQREAVEDAIWAYEMLAQRRRESGDPKAALALLTTAMERALSDKALELGLQTAQITESELHDPAGAIEIHERLLDSDPANALIWQPLLRLYRVQGHGSKLLALLTRLESEPLLEEERRAVTSARIHVALEEGDEQAAEESLRLLLADAPEDTEACALMLRLLDRQGRSEELVSLLERLLQAACDRDDGEQVCSHVLRLGELLAASDPNRARSHFQAALSWTHQNRAVLEAMLRLYQGDADLGERADVIERLLALASGEEAARLTRELIDLRQAQDDAEGAGRALALGYEACPESAGIKHRLFEHYRDNELWGELAELLMKDAKRLGNTEQALGQLEESARLFHDVLRDPARSVLALKAAHSLQPERPERLERLIQHAAEAGDHSLAIEYLTELIHTATTPQELHRKFLMLRGTTILQMPAPTLELISTAVDDIKNCLSFSADAVTQLIAALEQLRSSAQLAGNDGIERSALLQLTDLLQAHDQKGVAIDMLSDWTRRAENDREALRRLGELALQGQEYTTAADALERLLALDGLEDRTQLAMAFADACDRMTDPGRARIVLERVYRDDPTEEVRRRLWQLYESAGAYLELAALTKSQAQAVGDLEQRYNMLCEAGELLLRSDNPPDDAADCFRLARELNPAHNRAIVGLARFYTVTDQLQEAADLLSEAISSYGRRRSPALSELQFAMAQVAKMASDNEALFAWLGAALQSDRQNGEAAAQLAVLAMDANKYDLAIKALQVITLLKEVGPMPRAEAYLRQAVIANAKGDKRKAALLVKRSLTTDPSYEAARKFLESLG